MFADEVTPEQNKINQNLFEDNQEELERTVEQLSKLIETEAAGITDDTRMQARS